MSSAVTVGVRGKGNAPAGRFGHHTCSIDKSFGQRHSKSRHLWYAKQHGTLAADWPYDLTTNHSEQGYLSPAQIVMSIRPQVPQVDIHSRHRPD